jgi:stage IV sporulation protein FB
MSADPAPSAPRPPSAHGSTPNRRGRRRNLSFPIGSIAGIQIRVHVTFFLLVALFAFAGTAPGGMGVVSSLVWLVIIFSGVVVHELAHCLVGRPRGLVVHEIELLPIGGVSKLEQLPENPRDEFAMAIAGPAASAAIGVIAFVLAAAMSQTLFPPNLTGGPLLARIAWFNLILACFNLLPAFPLDGGRVLRALLERRYDLERSTRLAARAGRWVAGALVLTGLFWNLWLVIIGLFVYFGASAEESATIVHIRLRGVHVDDVMLLDPATVDARVPVADLQTLFRRLPQAVVPVVEAGRYVGTLDAGVLADAAPDRVAGDLADRNAPVVLPTDDLEEDLGPVVAAGHHAVVVVEAGKVVGLLRLDDVNRLLIERGPRSSTGRRSG